MVNIATKPSEYVTVSTYQPSEKGCQKDVKTYEFKTLGWDDEYSQDGTKSGPKYHKDVFVCEIIRK